MVGKRCCIGKGFGFADPVTQSPEPQDRFRVPDPVILSGAKDPSCSVSVFSVFSKAKRLQDGFFAEPVLRLCEGL
jgi:hypothetical protein